MSNSPEAFTQDDLMRMSHVLRHRLRNISAGINGAINLIATDTENILPPDLREYFPLVLRESDSLSQMASRLGLLWEPRNEAQPEAAQTITERVTVSASQQFPHVMFEHEGDINPHVSSAVEIALHELVINACESTPYGTVTITCSENGDAIQWTLSDAGTGIAEPDRERIFLPFFTTRPRHLGLGLALARAYAQKAGGTCHLSDANTDGCNMVLQVPVFTLE